MLLWNYNIVWIERNLFGKPFESVQENYLLCVYPEFTSEISLVISLHDWLTLRAQAADKNSIRNTLLSRFSKSTERPRAKMISLEALSKRQTIRIILPLTLRNTLRNSRRKVFAYLINC